MVHFYDRRLGPLFGHYPTVDALRQSASDGCHICSMFVHDISAKLSDMGHHSLEGSFLMTIYHAQKPFLDEVFYDLAFGIKHPRAGMVVTKLQLRPMEGQHMQALNSADTLPMDNATACTVQDGDESKLETRQWQVAASWIQECRTNHVTCRLKLFDDPSSESTRPTRLIDVGTDTNYMDVRLVNNVQFSECPPWVTLSHCWGKAGIEFTLLRNRLAEFQERIPFEHLAVNFKDAILTTRRLAGELGMHLYLWIDALCIIQKDVNDWAAESVKMGSIYVNGLCNLVASHGSDGSAGFLGRRDAFSQHQCIVEGNPRGFLSGRWRVGNFEAFQEGVAKSSVFTRAWVHQEISLAPRKLCFTKRRVFWHCTEHIYADDAPSCEHPGGLFRQLGSNNLREILSSGSLGQESIQERCYGVWHSIVETHSQLLITKDEDRLPSIAAIAQSLNQFLRGSDSYIAGIWKNRIPWFILWYTEASEDVIPAENGSPSWSWTSIKGPIIFDVRAVELKVPFDRFRPLTTFSDIRAEPVIDKMEFGQIRPGSASMKAKGTVLKFDLQCRVDPTVDSRNGMKVWTKMMWKGQEIPASRPVRIDYLRDWKTGDTSILCMPIVLDTDYSPGIANTRVIGLLLERDSESQSSYRRSGIFQAMDLGQQSLWAEAVSEAAKNPVLREGEYGAYHGDGVYTITLI
ncbi:HET-domain-containing protein [Thozetella sp. PMI_491]|nr:HET-domain-containing protein [Thozetella sp. PMI_491]